jgi:hypothetical protein
LAAIAFVHVPGMGREQARPEEVVPVEVLSRTKPVIPHHELELGPALVQMDGVPDVVLLREGSHGLQQLGR